MGVGRRWRFPGFALGPIAGLCVAALISCGGEQEPDRPAQSSLPEQAGSDPLPTDQDLTRGAVLGVYVWVSMNELQSGEIRSVAYDGTLSIRLPDGREVTATCQRPLLEGLEGVPEFNVSRERIDIPAQIRVSLREAGHHAVVAGDSAEDWRVVDILPGDVGIGDP